MMVNKEKWLGSFPSGVPRVPFNRRRQIARRVVMLIGTSCFVWRAPHFIYRLVSDWPIRIRSDLPTASRMCGGESRHFSRTAVLDEAGH